MLLSDLVLDRHHERTGLGQLLPCFELGRYLVSAAFLLAFLHVVQQDCLHFFVLLIQISRLEYCIRRKLFILALGLPWNRSILSAKLEANADMLPLVRYLRTLGYLDRIVLVFENLQKVHPALFYRMCTYLLRRLGFVIRDISTLKVPVGLHFTTFWVDWQRVLLCLHPVFAFNDQDVAGFLI